MIKKHSWLNLMRWDQTHWGYSNNKKKHNFQLQHKYYRHFPQNKNHQCKLRLDRVVSGQASHSYYGSFYLNNANGDYMIHLCCNDGHHSSEMNKTTAVKFSARDHDVSGNPANCPGTHKAGWWYLPEKCTYHNNHNSKEPAYNSATFTEMKISTKWGLPWTEITFHNRKLYRKGQRLYLAKLLHVVFFL